MDFKSNINSIFFSRSSFKIADSKDLLVDVGDDIKVGIRLFITSKANPTILFLVGSTHSLMMNSLKIPFYLIYLMKGFIS